MATIRKDAQSAYEIKKQFTHNGIEFDYEFKVYPQDYDYEYEPCFHSLSFMFMGIRFIIHKNFNSSREYLLNWTMKMIHYINWFGLSHLITLIDNGEIKFSRIGFVPSFVKDKNGYHVISIYLK